MNCKQGDLAIVVRSGCGNEGKIVRCLRFAGSPLRDVDGILFNSIALAAGPKWLVRCESGIRDTLGFCLVESYYADAWLRPIRGDLLDEEIKESQGVTA